ncbi:MAG: glycoside hydrolase family 5 protein [Bacteroidaceae bacterium]|nr:glycoside hydrolase family 5 protein [Bacteroidaceae bacterium]
MKRLNTMTAFALLIFGMMTGLTACAGGDHNEETNIKLNSCSINEGAAYVASQLKEVTLSYNMDVAISSSPSITLNGTPCSAKLSAMTAMYVIVTLPTLEEGTTYTLTIPEGAIVSKSNKRVTAPAFSVTFSTFESAGSIDSPAALTKKLGWGWNLGNHFDTSTGQDGTPFEWGYWDNAKPTKALYTNLKEAGVSTVRICVTWGNYQTASPWTIDANYIAEIKQNVDWAEAAGLNVILNLHHDEYWLNIKEAASDDLANKAIKERLEKTWTQIAEAFKDKGDFLFFEAYNEVQDGGWGWGDNLRDGGKQYRTLNEWNQLVVNTIRATGGKNATRWIGVPAYASNAQLALQDSFVLPTDAAYRIMVSVHYYDPSTFTLSPENEDGKSEWGHTAAAGKYQDGSNEDHVVEIFQKLHQKFIANNIPVYIGEYGCVMHTSERSNLFRDYYLEYVCRAAHTYGMPAIIWDNNVPGSGNEHHNYFSHNDGSYQNGQESIIRTMIRATTSDDASYTLESVYNRAPR